MMPQDQPTEGDLAAQLAELRANMENMSKSLEAGGKREERLQQLVATLASTPRQVQDAPVQTRRTSIDFSKLPNPTEDPEGYNRALGAQVDELVQSQVQAQVQPRQIQQDRQARINGLWDKFSKDNPDLADYRDIAEAVGGKMVAEAVAGGANPDQFVFGTDNGSAFLENLANKLNARLAQLRGDEDDGESDDGDTVRDPQGREHPRTIGIADAGGAAPKMNNGRSEAKPTTMIDELKAEQAKFRIY